MLEQKAALSVLVQAPHTHADPIRVEHEGKREDTARFGEERPCTALTRFHEMRSDEALLFNADVGFADLETRSIFSIEGNLENALWTIPLNDLRNYCLDSEARMLWVGHQHSLV